jgi:hypothetical protein
LVLLLLKDMPDHLHARLQAVKALFPNDWVQRTQHGPDNYLALHYAVYNRFCQQVRRAHVKNPFIFNYMLGFKCTIWNSSRQFSPHPHSEISLNAESIHILYQGSNSVPKPGVGLLYRVCDHEANPWGRLWLGYRGGG